MSGLINKQIIYFQVKNVLITPYVFVLGVVVNGLVGGSSSSKNISSSRNISSSFQVQIQGGGCGVLIPHAAENVSSLILNCLPVCLKCFVWSICFR